MPESKIRVGIVGAGGVGGLGGRDNSHAGGYRRCGEVELAAVADINGERLQQFGDEWGDCIGTSLQHRTGDVRQGESGHRECDHP